MLVRGASEPEAQARVGALAAFWRLSEATVMRRVTVLRGDTTAPGFGLAADDYAHLAQSCTHIVHCAALVRMNLPLAQARASAVAAAQNVLDLARAAQRAGGLRKVEFVSTVGVGGRQGGVLPERWIEAPRAFHNTYEQAKAEAEALAARGVADGLPLTVHRPSMVVGDSRTGEALRFQIFYHLVEFLSGRRTFGLTPALGTTRLDIVPVNYVADAIVWSSGQSATIGRVLHLCSGPRESPLLTDLQTTVRAAFLASGVPVPRLIVVAPRLLRALQPVVARALPAAPRRALAALPIFLDYLQSEQGFANAQTTALLEPAGIPLPKVGDYLPTILSAYLRRGRAEGSP
jgi:thioester reductase-like protein